MPITTATITPVATNESRTAMIATEKGHIVAVSLFPETYGTGPGEYYGEIWIVSTETPEPTPLIMLTSGGFGKQFGIHWTGRLPCEPSMAVRGIAGCIATNIIPCRLAVFTEID